MLLKANVWINELALYDIVNTPGVAADLSHVNTPAKVRVTYGSWIRFKVLWEMINWWLR
jgi:malate/lactate dehydrogenase